MAREAREPRPLQGQVALVTGGGAGLGAVVAQELAARGAAVAVHGRTAGSVAATVTAITAAGGTAAPVVGDLAAGDQVLASIVEQACSALGPITVLVNNAADQRLSPLTDPAMGLWRAELEVNLVAVAELTRLVSVGVPDRAGLAVVNISSVEGLAPFPNHAAYAASKAALLSLTAAAAGEFAPARVNAVAAGLIDRPGLAEAWSEGHSGWCATAPLGRAVTAAEVAAAVVFLASDSASGITGVTLPVDGGWSSSARTPWG